MWSDGVYQDGKHEQPIEAPETVAASDYAESLGLQTKKALQVAAGLCRNIICCHFQYERRSKRSADINNAVSYFIAKDMMPFWQKNYHEVK